MTGQLDGLVAAARASTGRPESPRPTAPRGHRKLSARTKQEIVDRYEAGERVVDIAQALSINKVTVIDHLNRAEVERRPRSMSETQIDDAVRLYASGLSLASIGRQLGFNASTIRTMIIRRGVKTRDPHGRER